DNQAGGAHRGKQVEVQHISPVFVGSIPVLPAARAADVIHQDIDATKALDGVVDEPLDVRSVGHIGLYCQNLGAEFYHLALGRLEGFLSTRREGYVTAFPGEIMYNSPANTPTASGHERYFPPQS